MKLKINHASPIVIYRIKRLSRVYMVLERLFGCGEIKRSSNIIKKLRVDIPVLWHEGVISRNEIT